MERRGLLKLAVHWLLAVVAVALWIVSVFLHDVGGKLFGVFFRYAQENWGPDGRLWGERAVLGSAAAIAIVVFLVTAIKVARHKEAAPELLARWVVWLGLALAANRYLICLQSENVHFAQYGFVAFFIALATRSPRAALLATAFLGFVDEAYQWWHIYRHDVNNHLDWSDMILDTVGATAGALPFTCFQRIDRYAEKRTDERISPWRSVLGVALLGGALAALVFGTYLGHYPSWPTWDQLNNKKPFVVLGIRPGIAAILAVLLIAHRVADERRRAFSFATLAALVFLVHLGVEIPKAEGVRVHEEVPSVQIPKATKPVVVDGKIEEWDTAVSVDLHHFAPTATEAQRRTRPLVHGKEMPTRALLQWDDKFLYVAFVCSTADIWARDFQRDDPQIPSSPCVELFLDTESAERAYYEFEVTPANRIQDLFIYWPQAPQWIPSPMEQNFVCMNRWDSHMKTAVQLDGECEVLPVANPGLSERTLPPSRGYSVEMAIPWDDVLGPHIPPKNGDRMRGNLFRCDGPRPKTMPIDGSAIHFFVDPDAESPGKEPVAAGWRLVRDASFSGSIAPIVTSGTPRGRWPEAHVEWVPPSEKPDRYVVLFSKQRGAQPLATPETAREWLSGRGEGQAPGIIECGPDVKQLLDHREPGAWEEIVVVAIARGQATLVPANVTPFHRETYMTWAPTHHPLDFHRPAFFGVFEFVER